MRLLSAVIAMMVMTCGSASEAEDSLAIVIGRDCLPMRNLTYEGEELCLRATINARDVRGCFGRMTTPSDVQAAIASHLHLPCARGLSELATYDTSVGTFGHDWLRVHTVRCPDAFCRPVAPGITRLVKNGLDVGELSVWWVGLALVVMLVLHATPCSAGKSLPIGLGRRLVRYLRHVPDKDINGWCSLAQINASLGCELDVDDLEHLRLSDDKRRVEVDASGPLVRARARMGHTVGVRLNDMKVSGHDRFYHVTSAANVNSIIEGGIRCTRSFVHAFPLPAGMVDKWMWPARRNPCLVEFERGTCEAPVETTEREVTICLFAQPIPARNILRVLTEDCRVLYEREEPQELAADDGESEEDERVLPPAEPFPIETESFEYTRRGVTKEGRRRAYSGLPSRWFYGAGVRFTSVNEALSQCSCCGKVAVCVGCRARPMAEDLGSRRLVVQCECTNYGTIEALGSREATASAFAETACQCTFASVFDPVASAMHGAVSMREFGPCLRDHVRPEPVTA